MADVESHEALPSVEIIRTKQEVRALDGDLSLLNNRVKHLELELSKVSWHAKITCHKSHVFDMGTSESLGGEAY